MSIELTLGWWMVPFILTAASMIWAMYPREADRQVTGDYNFGGAVVGVFRLGGAAIGSLLSWLIWALLV